MSLWRSPELFFSVHSLGAMGRSSGKQRGQRAHPLEQLSQLLMPMGAQNTEKRSRARSSSSSISGSSSSSSGLTKKRRMSKAEKEQDLLEVKKLATIVLTTCQKKMLGFMVQAACKQVSVLLNSLLSHKHGPLLHDFSSGTYITRT